MLNTPLSSGEEKGTGYFSRRNQRCQDLFRGAWRDLVHLVYSVFPVCLVRRTRETRQTRAPARLPLNPPSPHPAKDWAGSAQLNVPVSSLLWLAKQASTARPLLPFYSCHPTRLCELCFGIRPCWHQAHYLFPLNDRFFISSLTHEKASILGIEAAIVWT